MDIEYLTSWAKEFLLEDSTHAPTLFVQTDQQIIIAEVRDLPGTPAERVVAFGDMGRYFAEQRPGETLKEVASVMLGWASIRPVDAPPTTMRPSQDPNRKELLMISFFRLTDAPAEHQSELVEIMRNSDGTVRDLLQLPTPQAVQPGNEDPMLLAFIQGFKGGQGNLAPPPQRYNPDTSTGRHGKPPRRK